MVRLVANARNTHSEPFDAHDMALSDCFAEGYIAPSELLYAHHATQCDPQTMTDSMKAAVKVAVAS